MVRKKCSLHLYFSRIILSYAVLLKSRIYFLPVLDMKGKKVTDGDFQLWNLGRQHVFLTLAAPEEAGLLCSWVSVQSEA